MDFGHNSTPKTGDARIPYLRILCPCLTFDVSRRKQHADSTRARLTGEQDDTDYYEAMPEIKPMNYERTFSDSLPIVQSMAVGLATAEPLPLRTVLTVGQE